MAEENTEVCGFLDVKFCSGKSKVHKVKKRTLGPWKVWKRHWCSFQKLSPELGIKVHLDFCLGNDSIQSASDKNDSVIIPLDAMICRTQSRSKQFAFGIFPKTKDRKPLLYLAGNSEVETQRWMTNIRQLLRPRNLRIVPGSHNISIIDNAHSKASGLTGLYGDLTTNTLGVIIRDVHSGEVIASFEWKELGQFHLVTAGQPGDVECICVMHTTKEFRSGMGELHVFCIEATKLLQDLVTQGRGLRYKQRNRKALSLSEGDIRTVTRDELSRSFSAANEKAELKMLYKKKESNERYEEVDCKVVNKTTEEVYQPEPYSNHVRRSSNISTASGIYEEIPDEQDQNATAASNLYMEHLFPERSSQEPPPLPPRQRCASESMTSSRSHQEVRVSGPSSLPPLLPYRNSVQIERNNLEVQRGEDESNYVPMSPRLKDITLYNLEMQTKLQENDYVIMR